MGQAQVRGAPGPSGTGQVALALLALVLVGAGVPVVLAVVSGAWSVPMNDEWAYAHDAFTLHRSGQFSFDGWAEMSLVGQLVLVQPLLWVMGDTFVAVHTFGVIAYVVLVLATFDLVTGVAGRRRALGAAAVVALSAQLPGLVTSFMTDVPMTAGGALSAALGARALRAGRRRHLWLVASLAVGMVAFSIRETAGAVPAAVLLVVGVLAFRRRTWSRLLVVALAAAGVVAVVVLEVWRRQIPGTQSPELVKSPLAPLLVVAWTLCTLGVLLAPVLLALGLSGRLRPRLALVAALLLVVGGVDAVVELSAAGIPPLPGIDYLDPQGVGARASLSGRRPESPFLPAFVVLQVVAVLGAATLALLLDGAVGRLVTARRALRPPAPLAADVLLVRLLFPALLLADIPVMSTHWNDRYVLPLFWGATVLGLASHHGALARRAVLAACAAAGLLLPVGWAFAEQGYRLHAATWHLGRSLVAMGYAPQDVDAGFEWSGFHSATPVHGELFFNPPPEARPGVPRYLVMYDHQPCVTTTLSTTAPPGQRLLLTYDWRDAAGGAQQLYVYSWTDCPGTPLQP